MFSLISLVSTGATRVFVFDHTIRRAPVDRRDGTTQFRGPEKRVHIDQSYSASEDRVKFHLPDEAEELLKKRFQIINVSPHHIILLAFSLFAMVNYSHSQYHFRFGVP